MYYDSIDFRDDLEGAEVCYQNYGVRGPKIKAWQYPTDVGKITTICHTLVMPADPKMTPHVEINIQIEDLHVHEYDDHTTLTCRLDLNDCGKLTDFKTDFHCWEAGYVNPDCKTICNYDLTLPADDKVAIAALTKAGVYTEIRDKAKAWGMFRVEQVYKKMNDE